MAPPFLPRETAQMFRGPAQVFGGPKGPGLPPPAVGLPRAPINFISVNNNFTNSQTINFPKPDRFGPHNQRNYIMKFNSNNNDFYISSNLSRA